MDGSVCGLLGKNGAGKTTLMKLLCGLLKDDGGELTVNGSRPFGRKPSFLAGVFFLPESFSVPDSRVRDCAVGFGRFYPDFKDEILEACLSAMDVDPHAKFCGLSFGQRKKAMISTALSLGTPLLMLDEPGNGLDIPSKAVLKRLLPEVRPPGSVTLISTHNTGDIDGLCDRILILDGGMLMADMSVEGIAAVQQDYYGYPRGSRADLEMFFEMTVQ